MKKEYKIITVADTIEDKLVQQSLEVTAFAVRLAGGNADSILLAVPGRNVSVLCESISEKYGIDTVALEHEGLYFPNPEMMSEIIKSIVEEYKPETVIFSHTVRNSQTAARLSVHKEACSITAVETFSEGSDGPVFIRSLFNGKLKESVSPAAGLKILTVLPGAFSSADKSVKSGMNADVTIKKFSFSSEGYKTITMSSEAEGGVKLEEADVIVSAGRGIGKMENLTLIRETADIFRNSAIGGSRPVCDQRWLPLNQQVGVTGKTVTPKLYIACGISGSQQHITGMKNSQCIVAINKDPNAAIFAVADYIVIEDLVSFLPLLVNKYHERYGK